MNPPPRSNAEELLAHVGWVRDLARRLVADDHLADDLAQDACVAALEAPPSSARSLRAWLAGVLRNRKLEGARSGARRRAREVSAGRPVATPSTLELLERASVQRRLVGELMELEEPYRTTLLLRYFDDLSQREVGERLGVPASTVATRTARGIARLRERLQRSTREDGTTWLSALLPWLASGERGGAAAPTLTAGALLVSTSTKIVLAAGLVACAILGVRWIAVPSLPGAAGPGPAGPALGVELSAAATRADALVAASPEARAAVETSSPEPSAPPAPPVVAPTMLRGRVIDLEGRPLAGVEVCVMSKRTATRADVLATPSERCNTSDADGMFDVDVHAGSGLLMVRDPAWTTVLAGYMGGDSDAGDPLVVVGPVDPLYGIVVDEEGGAVAGAAVELFLHARIGELGRVTDYSTPVRFRVESDADGRFEMPDAPDAGEASVLVRAAGFAPWDHSRDEMSTGEVRVVLRRQGTDGRSLAGRVVDRDGFPIAGALVSGGEFAVRTDERGAFVVPLWGEMDVVRELIAVKAGYAPARRSFETPVRGGEVVDDLVLEGALDPLSIDGVVVDEEGRPLTGLQVEVLDRTPLGMVEVDDLPGMFRTAAVEEVLGGSSARQATTDAEGRFRVTGLLDRDYHLEAFDEGTLRRAVLGPVQAGRSGVTIAMVPEPRWERLEGRVVAPDGTGVAEVTVVVGRDRGRLDEEDREYSMAYGDRVVTDGDGRFTLRDVPREEAYLQTDGEAIVPRYRLPIPAGAGSEPVELQAMRRCHLQVQHDGTGGEITVLDAAGERVPILTLQGGSSAVAESLQVGKGLSSVRVVPETARTIVLTRDGIEVVRAPLRLVPGRIERVQL